MRYTINNYNYEAKVSTFPGGEQYVKIGTKLPLDPGTITIHADIRSSADVMTLLMLDNALRNYAHGFNTKFTLNLPYLPYARQDRICAKGESFSLKVFTDFINHMSFDEVRVVDCHSEVGLALLDNVKHITQLQAVYNCDRTHNLIEGCDLIIAPDAGAAKKAQEAATYYNKPMVQCMKTRKPDGSIEVTVLGNVTDKKCLILDDICDGGGTFIALAYALRDSHAIELQLVVTHGLFSKGHRVLKPYFTKIEAVYDWTI